MKFSTFTRLLSILLLVLATACGGGGGGGESSDSSVRVTEPAQDIVFRAGDTVNFSLATDDFNLAAPFNLRSNFRHGGGVSVEDLLAEAESEEVESESAEVEVIASSETEQSASGHDTVEAAATSEDSSADGDSHATAEEAIDGDGHGPAEINRDAKEGHYHVYLDDASGSDPHLTSWDYTGEYELPADLEPGTHSLRFELRDNFHTETGIETILFFQIVE